MAQRRIMRPVETKAGATDIESMDTRTLIVEIGKILSKKITRLQSKLEWLENDLTTIKDDLQGLREEIKEITE